MRRVVVTVAAAVGIAAGSLALPTQASAATAWLTDQTTVDKIAVSESQNRILAVGDGSLVEFNATTGAIVHTTPIGAGTADITVSTDGDTAYVSATDAHSIKVIDIASGAATRTYSLPTFDCARDLSPSKGRLYFVRCNNGTAFLGWIDLSEAGNVIHDGTQAGLEDHSIRTMVVSEDGSQIFMQMFTGEINAYASSSSGLALTATRSDIAFTEMSLDTDGEHLVLQGYQSVRFVGRDDLLTDTAKSIYVYGRLLSGVGGAFLVDTGLWCQFDVYGRDAIARSSVGDGRSCDRTVPAWLGSSLVTAKRNDADGTHTLTVNQDVTAWRTTLTLSPRKVLRPGGGAVIHGRITVSAYNSGATGPAPVGYDVHVTRTVDGTTENLPAAKVAADGSFAVTDENHGQPRDSVAYSYTFVGDEIYRTTDEVDATYVYGGVPWDFNSDGYADLAVGAPLENVGSIADAGSVTVIPGGPTGATGLGAVTWTQDSQGSSAHPRRATSSDTR